MSKGTYGTGNAFYIEHLGRWQLKYRPKWADKPQYKYIDGPPPPKKGIVPKQVGNDLNDWVRAFDAQDKKPVTLSIEQLRDLHIADMGDKDRESTKDTGSKWNKNICKFFTGRDLVKFEKKDFTAYSRHRKQQGAANATINRECAFLRRSLVLAQEEKLFSGPVPKFDRRDERPSIRQVVVEEAHYRAIMHYLPPRSQMYWCFAYRFGVRRGELLKLQWAWLLSSWKTDDPIVSIPGFKTKFEDLSKRVTKSGDGHYLPIFSDELKGFIELALTRRNPKCPYLFQDETGKRLTVSKLRDDFEKARADANLEHLHLHDTRRAAVVQLLDEYDLSEQEAMQVTGHLTPSMLDRYGIRSKLRAINSGRKLRARDAERTKLVDQLVDQKSESEPKGEVGDSRKLLN